VRDGTQRVEIRDDGTTTSLSVDDEVVLAVSNAEPGSNPGWGIGRNVEIVLGDCTPNEWRMVGALSPDAESLAELEVDQIGGDPTAVEVYQDEVTVSVDRVPWRWAAELCDEQWSVDSLVPDAEFEVVFELDVYMAGSMGGTSWEVGLRRAGPVLCGYEKDEIDGPYWIEFSHGEVDLSAVVKKTLERVDPPCLTPCPSAGAGNVPGCEDSGWEACLSTADWLDDDIVASLLDATWTPCDVHSADCRVEHGGQQWQWADGWTLC
jgi:hypothetical protein